MQLHADLVLELDERRIYGLCVLNGAHELVNLVAHCAAGNGTRVHKVVLDPDKIVATLTALIVKQTLNGCQCSYTQTF